jgi:anaerobic ribonucleoside-triphosphate reductase activating protein
MKEIQLNVAATCPATRTLGPGIRAVVWVQGCALHCPGCIAPDWIPMKPAHLIAPSVLAQKLLANPAVTGLTFSGGEPMLQAEGLARLVYEARRIRDIDVICFSGYQLEQLRKTPPGPGVYGLLECLDILIDGPYIGRYNDDRGMRGSSNQRIHYFTDRLAHYSLDEVPRKIEILVNDGHAMLVGVPTRSILNSFTTAMQQVQDLTREGSICYERA